MWPNRYNSSQPRSGKGKWALVALMVLAVLTIRGISKTTIVSADTATPASNLTNQLDQLQHYIALKPGAKPPLIYSKAYVLLDGETGNTIVADQADVELPIASTTKMTTALVAVANLPLDKVVTVPTSPPQIEGSKINLVAGEQITVGDLLKGLLINSGNDAAYTLAEVYSGTDGDYSQFVAKMNDFAANHNLAGTHFSDPAGLDDTNGHSSARDLANIARLLLQNPTLAAIVDTPAATVNSVDGKYTHPLKNTNRLIEAANSLYLPSALGIKTGYTPAAGHCLISAYKWQGRVLIGAVMNTNVSANDASAVEMNHLFRWADASLELQNY